MGSEIPMLAVHTVIAITVAAVFLIALMVGFSVVFNFPKLRKGGGTTLTVRSLDERLGRQTEYLPPTAPRGPADQLATPELLEVAGRKSG
ncbi:MAG: hypothetical protein ACRD26_22930 [Vicinamibacterales bacterium]